MGQIPAALGSSSMQGIQAIFSRKTVLTATNCLTAETIRRVQERSGLATFGSTISDRRAYRTGCADDYLTIATRISSKNFLWLKFRQRLRTSIEVAGGRSSD